MAFPQAIMNDYLTDNTAWFLTGTAAEQQTVTWRNNVETPQLTLENLQRTYDLLTNQIVDQAVVRNDGRVYWSGDFGGGPWLDDGTPVFKNKKQRLEKKAPLKSFGEMLKEGVKNG